MSMQHTFSWVRSILGILAGYSTIALLTIALLSLAGFASSPGALVTLIILAAGIFFAGVGGYVTGMAVPGGEIRHGFALGVLLTLLGMFSAIQNYGAEPLWFQIALVLGVLPAALIGGYLRAYQLRHAY